ncbi:hypothetical protein ACEQ8H_002129 [Pleosporales sp. CAS-2024a]
MSGIINKVKEVLHKDKDIADTTHGSHSTHDPVDRNQDGRVDARDLTGQQASHGSLTSHSTTGHSASGSGSGLTGALGQDASFAPSGHHNTRTADILDPNVSSGHGTTGSGLASHGTNGAFTGQDHSTTGGLGAGAGAAGLAHHSGHTANPVDRNNDGRVDARDLTGQGNSTAGGLGAAGAGAGVGAAGLAGQSAHTGHHGHTGHTANPIDRNNDGRVDARDLTNRGSTTSHTSNPLDRNNDGRVDTHDVSGKTTSKDGPLDHRQGESGDLPRALTEPKSVAQPHGFTEGHGDEAGRAPHGSAGAKASVSDKLNPHTDSDRDGKAGIMD